MKFAVQFLPIVTLSVLGHNFEDLFSEEKGPKSLIGRNIQTHQNAVSIYTNVLFKQQKNRIATGCFSLFHDFLEKINYQHIDSDIPPLYSRSNRSPLPSPSLPSHPTTPACACKENTKENNRNIQTPSTKRTCRNHETFITNYINLSSRDGKAGIVPTLPNSLR